MNDFLSLIHHDVCHPKSVVLSSGPMLTCTLCSQSLPVYEYISREHPDDHFQSSALAQAFHAWTGDERVPMNFPLVELEGIFSRNVTGQSLDRVRRSIRLLRALNAPFTTDPFVKVTDEMNTFLADFLNIIYEHPKLDSTNERIMLDALIKGMHDVLRQKDAANPFDIYFTRLVPYVQQSVPRWQPFPALPEYSNAAEELLTQLYRSIEIRKLFGKFVIPFDVIHVMVCCYACSSNLEVVGNWALDFLARICRGEFFWQRFPSSPFVEKMNRVVAAEVSYKKRTEFYNVIRAIRAGESIDHLSAFWKPFHDLQRFLYETYVRPASSEVLEMAFAQTFPTVLFQNHADLLGFVMAYNHVLMSANVKNGQLPKGVFKKAKQVHKIVQRFVQSVLEFDTIRLPWTMNTLTLFLSKYQDVEKEILDMVQLLITDDEQE